MTGIAFDKYEGLGNDFIVMDADDEGAVSPALARRLCDRRFGVGADGVLLVLPPRDSKNVARMRVVNADGSVPEMCGNGLRCVALHVARAGGKERMEGSFETDAGLRHVTLERERAHGEVRVDMGEVRLTGEQEVERVADGVRERVRVVTVDAGNPHAVLLPLVCEEHDRARIERWGPVIERDAAFPQGTNVELATLERDESVRVTVWERGVGFTLACGTGACAVVATLVARGERKEGSPVVVHLPGGDLVVTMRAGRATMMGPARHVFHGHAP